MALLIAVSDIHLDAVTCGFDRYDDLDRALTEVEDRCIEAKADAFAFVGDLCDPGSRSHRAVARAVRCAVRLRAAGIASLWVTGNHDVVEDGRGSHTMMPLAQLGGCVSVFDRPEVGYLPAIGAYVVVLPYVPTSHAYDPVVFVERAADEYVDCGKGRPVLVLSHLTRHEVLMNHRGSESTEMARGREMELPLDLIAERFPGCVVIQGHLHKRQSLRFGPDSCCELHVPGSLERLRFDEENHMPGWLEVEV